MSDGIWIPAEIWALDLPPLHRVFLARLQCLSTAEGGAWAGDDFLAQSLGCTPQYVRKMRGQLEVSGHIVTEGYGHKRRLRVEVAPVVAKVAPVGTSNHRNKQPQLQKLQPQLQELQPQLRQEATTVAQSKEVVIEISKEVVIESRGDAHERSFQGAPKLKKNGNTVQLDTKARPFDLAEVVDYFLEIDDTEEEANQFWDYWESAGWRRKNGPIRDWKASARTWIRSPYRKPKKKELIDQIKENLNYYNNHFNR